MSETPGLCMMVGGVIPDSKFRCDACFIEWQDDRRGNHVIKEGETCGKFREGKDGKEHPCQGKLKRIR